MGEDVHMDTLEAVAVPPEAVQRDSGTGASLCLICLQYASFFHGSCVALVQSGSALLTVEIAMLYW